MNDRQKLLANLAYADKSQARAAGYSLSQALAAGYSLSQSRAAGYSLSEVQDFDALIPLVEKPYTKMHKSICANPSFHDQATFGDWKKEDDEHVCKTAMCTAGNLVAMGGEAGWKLKEKFDFQTAAALIHFKAHPDYPLQDFGSIPQDWAIAYIAEMAAREAAEEVSV